MKPNNSGGTAEGAAETRTTVRPLGLPVTDESTDQELLRAVVGYYHTTLREFVLPYNDVAGSADPDATLLAFLEATYAAGAATAGWDRKSLERHQPESTSA